MVFQEFPQEAQLNFDNAVHVFAEQAVEQDNVVQAVKEFRTEGSSTINTIVSLANGSDGLENSDVAAFSKGNITISFLKPDWNGSQKNFARLVELATAIQKSRKPEAR